MSSIYRLFSHIPEGFLPICHLQTDVSSNQSNCYYDLYRSGVLLYVFAFHISGILLMCLVSYAQYISVRFICDMYCSSSFIFTVQWDSIYGYTTVYLAIPWLLDNWAVSIYNLNQYAVRNTSLRILIWWAFCCCLFCNE